MKNVNIINHLTLLLSAMIATMSMQPSWSLFALLAMAIILPGAFTIVVRRGEDKWLLKTAVARAIALGIVLVVSSSFVLARGVLEYQKTSVIPLWIHIIAILYILLYWNSIYAINAVGVCHLARLRQRVRVELVRQSLLGNYLRIIRLASGEYFGYEEEYLKRAKLISAPRKKKIQALVEELEFSKWLAKRFDYDADAAIDYVEEHEREIPQLEKN